MNEEQSALLISILYNIEQKCCFAEDIVIFDMITKLQTMIKGDEKHEPRISNEGDNEESLQASIIGSRIL